MRQRALPLILAALVTCFTTVHTGHAAEPVSTPPAKAAPRATAARANSAANATNPATLDARAQDVKRDVIALNRDLQVLEEELLYPASTQVAVFVSLDVAKSFTLDAVQVKLDDKVVANYLYKPQELAALQRGGVQRVYLGNVRAGEHELAASFTGSGPNERDYKRSASLKFDKGADAKYIQLRIEDPAARMQPELTVKAWQ
ncbi:MAG: AraC family transcriptional regulator [Acidobacteriota bacterium]